MIHLGISRTLLQYLQTDLPWGGAPEDPAVTAQAEPGVPMVKPPNVSTGHTQWVCHCGQPQTLLARMP